MVYVLLSTRLYAAVFCPDFLSATKEHLEVWLFTLYKQPVTTAQKSKYLKLFLDCHSKGRSIVTSTNFIIPNAFCVISTNALHVDITKSWRSVGTNDSQLFSLPNNIKNGYSEEQL